MANLILRDGTLHKRNGFEQWRYLGGTEEIKGAWLMKHDKEEVLIYVQGQKLYEYNISTDTKADLYTSPDGKISDTAMAFISGDDLYILCGEYIHCEYNADVKEGSKYNIYNLLNPALKRCYVPTTTRNIYPVDSTADNRERLLDEPINALSGWRKNELVWDNDAFNDMYVLFYLDAHAAQPLETTNPNNSDTNAPMLHILKVDGKRESFTFVKVSSTWWELIDTTYNIKAWMFVFTNDEAYIQFYKVDKYDEDGKDKPYGFETGDKLVVEFKAVKVVDGKEEELGLTSIDSVGAIFGNDGRADRLFIASGNFVRYTENTLEYLPKFDYVPVTNFVRCGSEGKVTSMMPLSNGTLAVFKDSYSNQEPSVYYISGKTIEAYTDDTGVVAYDDLFTVQAGNIEEKCPTPNAIATLAGDSLFVSPSGVYGIELSGNVAADDRFARERSRIINTKLTKFDLSKAKAIVHDNRYYLAVGGEHNEVYVADSRYKYTAEGDMSNTFNYEWFRWTDVPVSSWLIKDNELWFISKDNYLCRFTDKYYDKYLTEKGEVVIDDEYVKDGRVYFDKALLPIVERALYAEYGEERWNIENVDNDSKTDSPLYAFDAPKGQANGIVNLAFIVPVKAYWKSSVTALGSSIHRKNMYSLSVVVQPAKQSEVSVGYTTRLRDRVGMNAEGTNAFDFGDISFESYGEKDALYQFFSFDAGGFISAYRQRVFERNFVYAQLFFACESVGDCIVEEMSVEYTLTRKNIGVG
jgi:hypothetical protein